MNVFTACCIGTVLLVGTLLVLQQILSVEWSNSPQIWGLITFVAILGIVFFEIAYYYAAKLAKLNKQLEKEQL